LRLAENIMSKSEVALHREALHALWPLAKQVEALLEQVAALAKPAQRTADFSALIGDIAQLDQRFPNRVKRSRSLKA
jgi:hypothetical protein